MSSCPGDRSRRARMRGTLLVQRCLSIERWRFFPRNRRSRGAVGVDGVVPLPERRTGYSPAAERGGELTPFPAVMAYVFPGLGYAARGEVTRGALVCAGVMLLFLGGMLLGGIDVVDKRDDRWWFLLQAGTGPAAFVMDWVNQTQLKNPGTGESHRSLSHVNEIGSLAVAMAGMLNIIAVVDCLWAPMPVRERRRDDAPGEPSGSGAA